MDMTDLLARLSGQDIFLAACMAYVIHRGINWMRLRQSGVQATTFEMKNLNMAEVNAKCRELFPIDKLAFQGHTFMRGMRLRITTRQNNAFEGEFIGTNEMNLVCIRTQTQIVIHQKEKIEEITELGK